MRISHVSDTHGNFPQIPHFSDAIIHSGDILPDPPIFTSHKDAALWQESWLNQNINKIKLWAKNLPFYFIPGNHDYMDFKKIESILKENGIKAFSLDEEKTINGINIYGFPWVNYINGMFNYELSTRAMQIKCAELKEKLESKYIDILVCHGPMTNGLSNEGFADYGNSILEQYILSLDKNYIPSHMLVGHCHNANGIKFRNDLNMIIVNSATTLHSIDIK